MENDKIKLTDKQEKTILEYINYKREIKRMQDKLDEAKDKVMAIFELEKLNNVKLEFDIATICKKAGHFSTRIDSDKLNRVYPQVAEDCKKEVYVGESLSVVFK